jgi:hypothetical protein
MHPTSSLVLFSARPHAIRGTCGQSGTTGTTPAGDNAALPTKPDEPCFAAPRRPLAVPRHDVPDGKANAKLARTLPGFYSPQSISIHPSDERLGGVASCVVVPCPCLDFLFLVPYRPAGCHCLLEDPPPHSHAHVLASPDGEEEGSHQERFCLVIDQ